MLFPGIFRILRCKEIIVKLELTVEKEYDVSVLKRTKNFRKLLSASLLVTGTCVGAGMLGLPVVTGPSGLLPTIGVNLLAYLLMLFTGLLFLEVTLLFPDGANLMTISQSLLGRWGKWLAGISFLFLYLCFLIVYVSGGSPLLDRLLTLFGFNISSGGPILFTFIFGLIVWIGPRFVGAINSLLMVGLIASFWLLLGVTVPEIDTARFRPYMLSVGLFALPTLLSAFGYHNIIPTLTTYLKRDRQQLRWALVLGVTFSLVIYLLWQIVIIGALPKEWIEKAGSQGVPISEALFNLSHHPWIVAFSALFAFFALVTSFLGVSLSVVDFLADALGVNRKGFYRFFLILLMLIPPVVFSMLYPSIFMEALGLAGGIGEALMNGLLPIAFVIAAKRKGLSQYTHPFLLTGATFLILFIMILELITLTR